MKIIYAGTPEFAVPALKALIDSEHEIVAVYTQPDRPAGRGRKLTASPVKSLALQHNIPVEQPLNFKTNEALDKLQSYQADMMIVAAYGLILPKKVLQSFPLGCLNIHASILPRWRGAAPIQRAIIAGDKKTGVSIMQMEAGLDTGPFYLIKECEITETDTGSSLHDTLMQIGARALMECLPGIVAGTAKAIPQDNALATYANKLEKQEAKIDWQESAALIQRKIRAFNAWPVAFTNLDEQVIRVWEADFTLEKTNAEPGKIIAVDKNSISVACGEGILHLKTLQLPGKKSLAVKDILLGNQDIFKIGALFV